MHQLLAASERMMSHEESTADLRLLFAPGSSLGGARPKASIRDTNSELLIAKFPHKNDEYDTVIWESIDNRQILILKRFDRVGTIRIPFLSAMSMLGALDNEVHSYLELVDALRRYGAKPQKDIHELWRRLVFTILISNVDDHLRNHGFLNFGPEGWILSPAYDLNPTPIDIRPRFLSTAINLDDQTASLELAVSVADQFNLTMSEAQKIAREVGDSVKNWRSLAIECHVTKMETDRMSSAFEHSDLTLALK